MPFFFFNVQLYKCRNLTALLNTHIFQCKAANLDADVAFETGDVVCEGYDRSGDAYVLRGSCGVEVLLPFTHNYNCEVNNWFLHPFSILFE